MSSIIISINQSRRVAVNDVALSDNEFSIDMLLSPDGDPVKSIKYGQMRLQVSGDSRKLPDVPPSEVQAWIAEAVTALLGSKGVPAE